MKNLSFLKNSLLRHPLVSTLRSLRGNPKVCLLLEPMFGIPYFLYIPFATVYMNALGVSDVQIGFIVSAATVMRFFTTLIAGVATDKLGRRLTAFVFDLLGWGVSCLILAFSQNFWWFLAASCFNCFNSLANIAWTCLLVEDAPREKIPHIFTWITIAGRLSVFFAPLSALLVSKLTMVPAVRVLYLFAAICITAKVSLLFAFSKETARGKERKALSKGVPLTRMFAGYGAALKGIARDKRVIKVLLLMITASLMQTGIDNFFALYVTRSLALPQGFLAFYQPIRAVIILSFFLFFQHKLERFSHRGVILTGLVFYALAFVLLLSARKGGMAVVVLFVMAEGCAFAFFMPRRDALLSMVCDPGNRASAMSLITVFVMAASIPSGIFVGLLSQINPRLPFALNILLAALMAAIALTLKNIEFSENEDA